MADPRPVALVTGSVSDYRREPFALLAREEGVEVLAYAEGPPPEARVATRAGGREELPAARRTTQAGAVRLLASGRYRAVICGLGGRLAVPGSYLAARRTGMPFVLWAGLWAHPRTPAHALSYLPTRLLYRRADAIATYGPHVTAYVARRRGTAEGVFEAPQAVSHERFGVAVAGEQRDEARARAGAAPGAVLGLYVGRLAREKGIDVLLEAWRRADLGPGAVLALAGDGPLRGTVDAAGGTVSALGRIEPDHLPALYAAADFLVLPSIWTATFREPWGLVANEAMLQGTPIVASDAVGAVAGGLVVDERNGLVAPAGDAAGLAARLERLARDGDLRARLGAAAREDVGRFTYSAWVRGMQRALAAAGASRGSAPC